MKSPMFLEIKDLFTGQLIFSRKLCNSTQAFYFTNRSLKIRSNIILYIDSYTNQIRDSIRHFSETELQITEKTIVHVKPIPKYIEIVHEYMAIHEGINKTHRHTMNAEFSGGVGYKQVQLQQIDKQYLNSLIQNIFIEAQYILIRCLLFYVQVGDFMTIDAVKYRVMYVHHDFLQKQTTIRCHIYVKHIVFKCTNQLIREDSVKVVDEVEIYIPASVDKYYDMEISI